jgi:ADP-ribose pyrophosphatase YjhB (NUDIX family)
MNSRPKAIVNVYIFNSEGDKILMGKRVEDGLWGVPNGKLVYGEDFDECSTRLLSKHVNLLVDKPNERIKFLCTYNAVSKNKSQHLISIDYYIQVTREEEKSYLMINPNHFQSWGWVTFEEILKLYDHLYLTMQVFLDKFNITKLDDIKNIISN